MNTTSTLRPRTGDALIIVDVQNDFLPGGALAVPRGDEVVSTLNRYAALFAAQGLPVFATRDWHPPVRDAYSGFAGTELDAMLRREKVHRVFVGGLATDYCVLNTVKDASALGYEVVLLKDAIRAVDLRSGDGRRALGEMQRLGAVPADVESVEA